MKATHADCVFDEPCELGLPHECTPKIAVRSRDRGVAWGALSIENDGGGSRHFLDGKPIHAGDVLKLQDVVIRTDEYGEFMAYLPSGVVVRYESAWGRDGQLHGALYTTIGGHEFSSPVEQWMCFRLPNRGGG